LAPHLVIDLSHARSFQFNELSRLPMRFAMEDCAAETPDIDEDNSEGVGADQK
jgi:hypothetical protein